MLQQINILDNYLEYSKFLDNTRSKIFTAAFGLQSAEKTFIASGLKDNFVVYVVSDYLSAQRVTRQLNQYGEDFYFLPHKDELLLYKRVSTANLTYERNKVIDKVLQGQARGIVVCIDALCQLLPSRKYFETSRITVKKDAIVDIAQLSASLTRLGYSRCDTVSATGEYSVHGDIIEVHRAGDEYATRIDFFDDEVESIKKIDESKRSVADINEIELFSLRDTGLIDEYTFAKLDKAVEKQKLDANAMTRLIEIVSSLRMQGEYVDNSYLAPFVESGMLSDFLPDNTVILWDEPKLITDRIVALYKEHIGRVASLLIAGEILPQHIEQFKPFDKTLLTLKKYAQNSLQVIAYGNTFFTPIATIKFISAPLSSYRMDIKLLVSDMTEWIKKDYKVAVFCGKLDVAKRLANELNSFGLTVAVEQNEPQESNEPVILPIAVDNGFVSHSNSLVVVGIKDIVTEQQSPKLSKSVKQVFLSPVAGDYVVHEAHGIGLCEGIQTIENSGESKDYIVVKYRYGDTLYLPVESSNLLSRYSGGGVPQLSKLGGGDFLKVKEKVKSGIKKMAIDLVKLYALREKARGFRYHIDDYLDKEFDATFDFTETEDQLKCIEDIDRDLTSDRIMDRLLVGDVGYGKTEVAMRTAFKVVSNGYQVALLAPTTILAEQHYNTLKARMSNFDIKVACLNRFRKPQEQRNIIKRVFSGDVDILVGTHRLLSKDIVFNKLGLLILDEEQRFGVEHKEKIKTIKNNIDVLTLSATPIPRTLHMALTGMRDISVISTPPRDRMPIETFVMEDNDTLLRDVILREINREGQVFLVYNNVETIDYFAERVTNLVPEAKITIAHGQMEETCLEDNIYNFSKGKYNVLVCSTIIENGIDMPNANTMIVYDADKLGLSQLYQLRGRVGRSSRLAYAYFIYRENKVLSEIAFKRLNSIME
ncbi:MAG: CarD family transcriptional regulator, partial [Clostridia bacterium]